MDLPSRRGRLLAILRQAADLPGYRLRFERAGLQVPPRSVSPELSEREWGRVWAGFLRLEPLDRSEIRAQPAAFFRAGAPVFYRGMSSGTQGRAHVFFGGEEWNAVRLRCRERALRTWGLADVPIVNLASRLRPAGPDDACLAGVVDATLCSRLHERLSSARPVALRGYPSRLCEVAAAWRAWCRRQQIAAPAGSVRAVISTGECLWEGQRSYLAATFEAPVVDEYGCHEAGLSGVTCPQHGVMHLDGERAWVEVVDGEVVATDLWNEVMPVVRYRCGDRAEWLPGPCSCGHAGPAIRILGRREAAIGTRWGKRCEGEVPVPELPGVGPFQAARMPGPGARIWAYPGEVEGREMRAGGSLAAWARGVLGAQWYEVTWLEPELEPRGTPAPDGAASRWKDLLLEGPWDLEEMAATVPAPPLVPFARLLLEVGSPETITSRPWEPPPVARVRALVEAPALPDPELEVLAARILALVAARLAPEEAASRTLAAAIDQRLARCVGAPPPPGCEALWERAASDLAILRFLTLPVFGAQPSTPRGPGSRRPLDALAAHHLLAALEAACEDAPGRLRRRLPPLLSLLIGDAHFFAPRLGDWLLASWAELLGRPVPSCAGEDRGEAGGLPDDPFCRAWIAARRHLVARASGGRPAPMATEAPPLDAAASTAAERARADLEEGYLAVVEGRAGDDPMHWVRAVREHAEVLSDGLEPHELDPVPWAPILRALPEALGRRGEAELAYQCLVLSTRPSSGLSAFDRLTRQVNEKIPMLVDLSQVEEGEEVMGGTAGAGSGG